MPSRAEIVSFDDSPPPPGAHPWVPGAAPAVGIEVTDPNPAWPQWYDDLAGRIRAALGWRGAAARARRLDRGPGAGGQAHH